MLVGNIKNATQFFINQVFDDKATYEQPWGHPYLSTPPPVVIILGVWSWAVFGHRASHLRIKFSFGRTRPKIGFLVSFICGTITI